MKSYRFIGLFNNADTTFLKSALKVRHFSRYSPLHRIPVVDFSPLKTGMKVTDGSVASMQLADKVFEATTTFGFCQIVHHPMDYAVIKEAFYNSQEFFSLPLDIKQTFYNRKRKGQDSFHGYLRPQKEIIDSSGLMECRENFDWMEGKGNYPGKFFEDAMLDLHLNCKVLEKLILRLWAIGLGLDDIDFLVKLYDRWDAPGGHRSGVSNIRLAYYPPKNDLIKFKHVFEDPTNQPYPSLLSFVFQDTTGGLQVQTPGGKCIPVLPIPHSIILNVGEIAEILTRGMFPATTCRLPVGPSYQDNQDVGRYSIAYYSGPRDSSLITPLTLNKQETEKHELPKASQKSKSGNTPEDSVNQ